MVLRLFKVLAAVITLSVIVGCASSSAYLSGKEKLEAKDWLRAGDLSFKNNDWDNAQYFYDLVVKKYPESYYGKKAKENLGYVSYRRGPLGRAVDAGKDALSPIF